MSTEKEVTTFFDLLPFIGLGAAGGFVKALNDKNFNLYDMLVRIVTGAFCALLGGLYLTSTSYPLEVQYAFSGAVGVAGSDLIKALMVRMTKEIAGETVVEEQKDYFSDGTGGGIGADTLVYVPDNTENNSIDDNEAD